MLGTGRAKQWVAVAELLIRVAGLLGDGDEFELCLRLCVRLRLLAVIFTI